jgi:hypothetical protein
MQIHEAQSDCRWWSACLSELKSSKLLSAESFLKSIKFPELPEDLETCSLNLKYRELFTAHLDDSARAELVSALERGHLNTLDEFFESRLLPHIPKGFLADLIFRGAQAQFSQEIIRRRFCVATTDHLINATRLAVLLTPDEAGLDEFLPELRREFDSVIMARIPCSTSLSMLMLGGMFSPDDLYFSQLYKALAASEDKAAT